MAALGQFQECGQDTSRSASMAGLEARPDRVHAGENTIPDPRTPSAGADAIWKPPGSSQLTARMANRRLR